jgi:hypothetical protein
VSDRTRRSHRPRPADRAAAKDLARDVIQAGGFLPMDLEEVLSRFNVRRPTDASKARVEAALRGASVKCYPTVTRAQKHDSLALTVENADAPRVTRDQASPARAGVGRTDAHHSMSGSSHPPAKRPFWRRPLVWLGGTIAAAIIGTIVTSDWVRQPLQYAGALTPLGHTPVCGDTGWLREVDVVHGNAQRLDYLRHPARDTLDDDESTSWIDKFDGSHFYISWYFGSKAGHIKLICIRNGWARDTTTYTGAGRLRAVQIVGFRRGKKATGGRCTVSHSFSERRNNFIDYEGVAFDCRVDGINMYILRNRPGTLIRGFDLSPKTVAISDVSFYRGF